MSDQPTSETSEALETLREEMARLDRKVEALSARMTDMVMNGWEARIDQLQLQAALGRMEVRDEVQPRIERLRKAYETARNQLAPIPGMVGDALEDASADLRPVLEQLDRAYKDAKAAIS
jgi:archaellum component FlaC